MVQNSSKNCRGGFYQRYGKLTQLINKPAPALKRNYERVILAILFAIAFPSTSLAQITPDTTLPVNSTVTPNGNINIIEGGTRTGNNLFHSFESFSLPTNNTAFFNNALEIQNIFSRVTGNYISNIDGIIRANGTANLFLINPNGIIFGANARLNIGGSFFASTARSLNFADGTQFSTAPTAQTPPLLTVNVPIGLQLGTNAAPIQVQGSRLAVLSGQTLALVGGDVTIAGGNLLAPGGRIELASVSSGQWSLGNNNQQLVTNYGNIQLDQQAILDTSNIGAGEIQLAGGQVTLTGQSQVIANTLGNQNGGNITIQANNFTLQDGGFVSAYTFGEGRSGNIFLNASDSVNIIGTGTIDDVIPTLLLGAFNASLLRDGIFTGSFAAGDAGDLTINTRQMTIREGGRIASVTSVGGRGGDLIVNATNGLEIIGTRTIDEVVDISDNVSAGLPIFITGIATGTLRSGKEGGNLTVTTPRLIVRDRAGIISATTGSGVGGNLTLNAGELVDLRNGSIVATLAVGTGNAGDLNVTTGQLNIVQRGGLSSSSLSAGNAGNLSVNARGVFVERAFIAASTGGKGKGGNLTINASELVEVATSSSIQTGTAGEGNYGNLTINAPRIIIQGFRAGVSTLTTGAGKGGILTVNATESVEIVGDTPGAFIPTEDTVSFVLQNERRNLAGFATVNFNSSGDAGDLIITTPRLLIRDGAGATTSTLGTGLGGNLTVNASESVTLIGRGGLVTATFGNKKAGNLTVNTPRLNLQDGAAISADTFGAGNAGNLTIDTQNLTVQNGSRIGAGTLRNSTGLGGTVTINAQDSIDIIGTSAKNIVPSGVFASTLGTGNAGDLNVETGRLTVGNGAQVTVSGEGAGAAGNLNIIADTVRLDNQGSLRAETQAGDRGNITLQTSALQMRRNSNITTNAFGTANGGNININSDTLAALENSDIRANAIRGRGGSIQINTQGIYRSFNSDIDASSQLGINGIVEIKTPDIDPTQGLVNIPGIDESPNIVTGCQPTGREASSFTITGTGGLPPNPTQPFTSEAIWRDPPSASVATDNRQQTPDKIVEAQGWVRGANGEIILTAEPSGVTPYSPSLPIGCYGK
ncbi:two-partner secretion domain-containing protein [Microseira wollei]|uniref:Filamentous hemagglutinin family outer membrane protein n=1 Tax=Microseira wollei NIES-4236 TaxID=2530354 RepID=A0AAV3WKT9_9CYAN|nr:filamentous hemagglutinin N-terminal domain-containing protein [Microseira wollei]GET41289.1 filamentous hemagglutinin family outer membrane protein [Microseira wollei NIES-4236]